MFLLCEITGGNAAQSMETGGAEFFPLDALPELSTSRVTARQIRRMADLASNPAWPADFD
jgi:hypothetical protein